MDDSLQAILADFESDLGRVQEIASLRLKRLLEARLTEWRERYPRHAFKAWEGHGMLSLDVLPIIGGESCGLELMNPKDYKGAIADLITEAREIVGAFNSAEQRVSLFVDDFATEGWPK